VLKKLVPAALWPWLIHKGSLTRRLKKSCAGELQVRVLRQDWGKAYFEETQVLGIHNSCRVWQREVLLLCDTYPWVYAKTIIPISTLHGSARRLLYLNNRPLGAVLFSDPAIIREKLEIISVNTQQYLYQKAIKYSAVKTNIFWGRRSLFWISRRPLLVTEIFLQPPG